ncbi:MAG TPA: TRAP transporter fused permease subunit [Methylomirabilota bacterium]|nr:TRAP transporter fused permease subunit [Methylomirabilota bacterium]
MSAIWTPLWGAVRFVFAPEMKPRRRLRAGLVRENLALWALVSGLILVVWLALAERSFQLFLPHYAGWQWVEVTVLRVPTWAWLVFWVVASGLCLYPRVTASGLAMGFALYYVYAAANGSPVRLPAGGGELFRFPYLPIYAYHYFLPLFILLTGVLTFVFYPARDRSPRDRLSGADVVLCLVLMIATFDFVWNFAERGDRAGLVFWNDVIFGTALTIISVEMCRRVLGLVLPLVGMVFFAYAWLGPYFPEALSHRGFPYNEAVAYFYTTDGIYGTIANVFATYVFLFIVFGVMLEKTKVGDVFVDLAFALVGRFRGGAAKASVVSSGLVGSVVGSGAANIAITGTFTIPLMKRSGYMPHYAAAVEAVASIGGHLMPPIMGSAAFLVAAFTEASYPYIALVSLVPALMYYYSVYLAVHYRACRRGIGGLPAEELPDFKVLMKKDGYLLLPVALLILLLVIGFSPFYAAFWCIASALTIGCFRDDTRLVQLPAPLADRLGWGGAPRPRPGEILSAGPRARYGGLAAGGALLVGLPALFGLSIGSAVFFAVAAAILFSSPRLIDALVQGSVSSLVIGATAGIMGIVLAGVTMPGLALRFSAVVLEYAGGSLPLAIVLCAIASYILGMGMTITASYVLLAILAVPALVELGVPELNAHLIVLWLSQDASLTPPFALGAFIAAGLAGADPMRTGFTCLKLAKPLYILPFLMAYSPVLMDPGTAWWEILLVWVTGFAGFFCAATALEGYFRRRFMWWERGIFLTAALAFFFHVWWMKVAAVALMALGIAVQRLYTSPDLVAPPPLEVAEGVATPTES